MGETAREGASGSMRRKSGERPGARHWGVPAALVLALTTISGFADGSNMHGTVTDPLGAVVPGAQVELLRQGKPVSSTTTDSEGKYRFSPLPPGRYQVKTAAPSFATQQSDAIY